MKQCFFLLLLFLFPILIQGQIPLPIDPSLHISKIKSSSLINEASGTKAWQLVGFNSTCNIESTSLLNRLQERVVDLQQKEDTVIITVMALAKCGEAFLAEIEVLEQDSLNLKYEAYGQPTTCDCLYEFQYLIKVKLKQQPKHFQLNGRNVAETGEIYITYPVQFELYHGDTINLTDKYGMRQGYWLQKDSLKRVRLEGNYHNEQNQPYSKHYSEGFVGRNIISYHGRTNQVCLEYLLMDEYEHYSIRHYDKQGRIRSECYTNEARDIYLSYKEY